MASANCVDAVIKAAGRNLSDEELLRLFEDVRRKAAEMRDAQLLTGEAEAGKALAEEARAAAAMQARNQAMNLQKRIERRAFYESAPAQGSTPGVVMGLEAKLVGVNTAFKGSRLSVAAEWLSMAHDNINGLVHDLEHAGLDGAVIRGDLDRQWARELAELNKADGKPGISGSKEAQQIAAIVHKYQRLSVDNLNRAGAWIGDYEGYISRTSHDADRIRRAGYDTWRGDIMRGLDTERTFAGVEGGEAGRERFLKGVYDGLVTGVHLTQEGMQGFKDPAFQGPGNLAKRLSQDRVLHFKDADGWLDYQGKYGRGSLIEEVARSLETAARNTALMHGFGTNPRAEFEADLRYLREKYRGQTDVANAVRQAEPWLTNRFDQLDGTASQPINALAAEIGRGVRNVESMSKLGGMLFSHFGLPVTRAAELKYQGVGFLRSYADTLPAMFGRTDAKAREIYSLLRAGFEGMASEITSRMNAADGVPGKLAKLTNTFFKLSGIHWVVNSQRKAAVWAMSRHLGSLVEHGWEALPAKAQRILSMYGIDDARWDLLRRASGLIERDGEHFLTPDAAMRVDDAGVAALLRNEGKAAGESSVDQFKRDLALQLHSYFADRADYAVVAPGARERAMLLQGTRPGTVEGEALRYIAQFKTFPAAMISKVWGREIYGNDGKAAAIGGILHMAVAGMVMGGMANYLRDLSKGLTPRPLDDPKTMIAALLKGGGTGLLGDFLFGEYNRFGGGAWETVLGPTASTVGQGLRLFANARESVIEGEGMAGSLGAGTFRLVRDNFPFINLFYTRAAMDYLFLWQVEEAMNPGFLRRWERRVKEQNGQSFFIRPSSVIPYGGGNKPFVSMRGGASP